MPIVKQPSPIHFIVPFWGETYRECFLAVLLPSLLAPHNIPAWPFCNQSTFVIYTTEADFEHIRVQPKVKQLRQWMNIEFRPVVLSSEKSTSPTFKYDLLSQIHQNAIKMAHDRGAALILPVADLIFSDGSLTALAAEIAADKELVMILGLLADIDKISELYDGYYANGVLSISAEACIEFYLSHMNGLAETRLTTSPYFSIWPSHLGERDHDGNLFLRAFHIHPLYIRNPRLFSTQGLQFTTIDGDYLQQYDNQRAHIAVMTDKRMICLSLAQPLKPSLCGNPLDEGEKFQQILTFAGQNCTPIHRWFFTHRIQYSNLPPSHQSQLQMEENHLMTLVEQALEPVLQIEAWYLAKDYAAIVQHYGHCHLATTCVSLAFCGYYTAWALFNQGQWLEMGKLIRHYLDFFKAPHWGPNPDKPLFLDYLKAEQQHELTQAALPLTDLDDAPMVWLWAENVTQLPSELSAWPQLIVQFPVGEAAGDDFALPQWLIQYSECFPHQAITVLAESMTDFTWLLLSHQADLFLFASSTEQKIANTVIYRLLQDKDCGIVTNHTTPQLTLL